MNKQRRNRTDTPRVDPKVFRDIDRALKVGIRNIFTPSFLENQERISKGNVISFTKKNNELNPVVILLKFIHNSLMIL